MFSPLIPLGGVHVQYIVAPCVGEVSATGTVAFAEHITWFCNENCTKGAGLTVKVKVFEEPGQVTPPLVYLQLLAKFLDYLQ